MDIIDKIDKYYKDQGIHSLHFTCKHKKECSSNCKGFTGPKSAFLPDKYGSSYPRIAFLSLDSGDGVSDPKERTPRAVRRQEQIECVVERLPKGHHWYETHVWAQAIYNAISTDHISLENIHNCFCHLNSVKCCQNKLHAKEADPLLFRNCQKYVPQELKLIAPHILVTQGNRAHNAIKRSFVFERIWQNVYLISSPIKFLWVRTYHPAAYGYYYRQKKDLNKILKILHKNMIRVV